MASDSADPQQLLNDLRQIAAVCQRLGIDLGKVAAMGQTIGGKGTTGSSPLGTQNPDHQGVHPGGGTGYDQLGQLSALSGLMSTKGNLGNLSSKESQRINMLMKDIATANPGRNLTGMAEAISAGVGFQKAYGKGRFMEWHAFENLKSSFRIGDEVVRRPAMIKGIDSIKKLGSRIRSNAKIGYAMTFIGGDRMNRRFGRMITTIHGLQQVYGALAGEVDYDAGETRAIKVADATASTFSIGMRIVQGTAMSRMVSEVPNAFRLGKNAYRLVQAGRAASTARTLFAGAKAVAAPTGIGLAIVAATEAAIQGVTYAVESAKEDNKSSRLLGKIASNLRGVAHGEDTTTLKVDDKVVAAWNKSIKSSVAEHYYDADGNKIKRGEWSRGALEIALNGGTKDDSGYVMKTIAAAWAAWEGTPAMEAREKEQRAKDMSKYHKTAVEAVEFKGWKTVKENVRKAKEAVMLGDKAPFFWREPEKFLKNMESARIAGRNWARSQQPRGGSRTGD